MNAHHHDAAHVTEPPSHVSTQHERADDGKTIEERLSARIQGIAADITKYANICDTFSKKKTIGMSFVHQIRDMTE